MTTLPNRTSLPLKARRIARETVNAISNCKVELATDPNQPPTKEGEGFYHETLGGTRVRHPSAYAKKGWSNLRYVHSTIRVTVGRTWLAEHAGV